MLNESWSSDKITYVHDYWQVKPQNKLLWFHLNYNMRNNRIVWMLDNIA